MKRHPTLKILAAALLLLVVISSAQAQKRVINSDSPHNHGHDIFTKIDRAYQEGKLSVDQKVLLKFYATQSPEKLPHDFQTGDNEVLKCGTPALSDYHKNKARLSRSTVSKIESFMQPTGTQTDETHLSPSGKFTIHFTRSGPDAVPNEDANRNGLPDYVEEVAEAADSTYRHEVLTLGYPDPIPAGETYDIEILNLATIYGQTFSPTVPGGNTFIQIENDYDGFPANDDPEGDQIGAMKVTVAHEFKHAIHYTISQWQGETAGWLEMDAVMMEELVYDDVNDYYNYLTSSQSIFSDPEQSFYPGSYYHATWALYFEQRYGPQFWVDVWEIIRNNPSITMVNALRQKLGGDVAFTENYIMSQLWHYASGPENSRPNFGFEESANYPAPPAQTEPAFYSKNLTIPRSSPLDTLNVFSAKYYNVPLSSDVEGNIELEVLSRERAKGVGLIAYYNDGRVETSTIPLVNRTPSFEMSNIQWDNIEQLGLVLTNSATTTFGSREPIFVGLGSSNLDNTLSQNYPNPFNPQTRIRFTLDQASDVELKIYDSAGRLVETLVNGQRSAGVHEPVFDGSGLASGVYFYQLITDGKAITKKMTLIK